MEIDEERERRLPGLVGSFDHFSREFIEDIRETLIDDLTQNTLERRTRTHRIESNGNFSRPRTSRSFQYIPFRIVVED